MIDGGTVAAHSRRCVAADGGRKIALIEGLHILVGLERAVLGMAAVRVRVAGLAVTNQHGNGYSFRRL